MTRALVVGTALAVSLAASACGGGEGPSPAPVGSPNVASEDERGSVGVPNPSVDYCKLSGHTLDAEGKCAFADGTGCEPWSFFRGECGQEHSYCAQHGGALEIRSTDGYTRAVCVVGGHACDEYDYARAGKCPP